MHRSRVVETTYCDASWEALLSTDTSVMRLIDPLDDHHEHEFDHGAEFDRWTQQM